MGSTRDLHSRRGRQPFASATRVVPELLPLELPVDEEQLPRYKARSYYPANPDDVLDSRYRLVAKLGWGSDSTVWLSEVIPGADPAESRKHVAIKICNCDIAEQDRWTEMEVNRHLATVNPEHGGRMALGTAFEAFEIESPRGGDTHIVLVFDPLREPLWLFRRRITDKNSTFDFEDIPVLKTYIQVLLDGLDYMHSQGHIIHTDLKLDNIMVTFEDPSVVDDYVRGQAARPMARKEYQDGHTVYRCHNNFGRVSQHFRRIIPIITDFGLAQRGDASSVLLHPIQPDHYHAPEVLLGLGWSYSADIWNLGLVIWEFLAGEPLFSRLNQPYMAGQHLAEMAALLGDIPPEIVEREKQMRHWRWTPEARNPAGKLCDNAADYFGGPFFDENGNFLHKDLITQSRKLESEVPEFLRTEAILFLQFMKKMLCWFPEDRATAGELINHPWLGPCRWRQGVPRKSR